MQIFGFPTSPFVRKVLLVASEKSVDFELVPATPHKPTEEFLAASPFRMMPAMQDGDFRLPDSTAIAFYIDAKFSEPPILPGEPELRGKAMWMNAFADTILSPHARGVAFNRYIGPELLGMAGDAEAAAQAEERALPALDYLEKIAPEDGWLAGARHSLADIAVASCLKTFSYGLDVKARPRTAAWLDRVEEREAWRKVAEQEAAMIRQAKASGEHR